MEPDLDPKLDSALRSLRRTPTRDPQLASRARDRFLAESAQLAPGVSFSPRNRLDEWKGTLKSLFVSRKEKNPMFNLVASILFALVLLFGGGATTLVAAQSARPDEALYPLKTWSEDLRWDWETDPAARLDLTLELTDRRVDEIQALLTSAGQVPEPVLARLQDEQQQALALALGMPENLVVPALAQVQDRTRQQEQVLAQLQLRDQAAQQNRARVRELMQAQQQSILQNLENHPGQQPPNHQPNQFATPTGSGATLSTASFAGATVTSTPCSGYGPGGPQSPVGGTTPTPGSSYGPGSGSSSSQQSQNNGQGNGGSSQGGQNPNPTTQPGSGGGNGNGGKP